MGKKERLQNRVNRIDARFKTKVREGKKGTDMDIAKHEARIQRLAYKGGFSTPFMAKSPLNDENRIVGQDTSEIKSDDKGEYVTHGSDTIRPADGKNFKKFIKGEQSGKMDSGYLSDDDYTIKDGKIVG